MSSLTGAMESVTFAVPTGSLKIIDTATGVTVVIIGDLILAGVGLEIDAPTIIVNSGVTIDTRGVGGAGTVLLNATDTQTGAAPASASVSVNGATIHAKSIDLEATASQTPGPGSIPGVNTVTSSSSAQVAVTGSSVLDATGDVTLRSSSSMQATVSSTGTGTSTSVDAAIALADTTSSATTHVSDHSTISAAETSRSWRRTRRPSRRPATLRRQQRARASPSPRDHDHRRIHRRRRATSTPEITAKSVSVSADATTAVVTTATSSPGGSTGNSSTTPDSATDDAPAFRTERARPAPWASRRRSPSRR